MAAAETKTSIWDKRMRNVPLRGNHSVVPRGLGSETPGGANRGRPHEKDNDNGNY
jgi:hypothetical protein